MKEKKKKKTNIRKTFSIFILIYLLIKLVVKFLRELVIKIKTSEEDGSKEENDVEVFEEEAPDEEEH
ncbi:MAG: hypothetical protein P9L89_05905 [Candidatus Celaenobacter polaris]|nr:hypothetical protein [Candidatus Celaenobacter polaris]